MRARIIIQGLTVFTHEYPMPLTGDRDKNLGKLTAWLVSDPMQMHNNVPLHTHRPYLGFIGRDAHTKASRVETKHWIPAETTIALEGHGLNGVVVDQSYLDYVPRLGDLHPSDTRPIEDILASLERSNLISARIDFLNGTIRAREFIAWDWHGNTPSRVAYMDTNIQGFATNEIVIDVGDDSDIDDADCRGCLVISGKGMNMVQAHVQPTRGYEFTAELCSLVRTESDYDIDPNTVEVRITNLPARRARPLFYGMHAQVASDAAGYTRRDYKNSVQYRRFADVADRYDHDQWMEDEQMIVDQPFPFLINPTQDKLDGLKDAGEPGMAVDPPKPYGRQAGEFKRGETLVGHGTGDDPQNTEICPFTRVLNA